MPTGPIGPEVSVRARSDGLTLLEVLVVAAIVGVMAGLVAISGRPIVRGQESAAAVRTVQQSVWQGATMAASRGIRTQLVVSGNQLAVQRADDGSVIRRFELPEDASLSVDDGPLLTFTPPGKVDESTLPPADDPLRLSVGDRTYTLQVSLIGEVRATGVGP